MREIKTITVLGAGDMGHGIAEIAALRGMNVRMRDIKQDILDKAMEKVKWSLSKLAEHDTITREAADQAYARISATTDLAAAVRGADLVIEAVPENLDLKRRVFAEVESFADPQTVLASNTSTMRITEIGASLRDPSRLVGMHFFNPVLLMDLIEVIPGEKSSPAAVQAVVEACKRFGKTVVVCHKDSPGFITSRLIGVWVGAAIVAYEHKAASMEAIDSAMKFRGGFPMGPFELADYTGIDIGYHASQYIASHLGDAYKPAASLEDLMTRGHLGKKTGRGFYAWENNRMTTRISPDQGKDFDPALVMAVVANEAARLLDAGAGSAQEIDRAMRNGCAFPKGPLEWADDTGLDTVLKTVLTLKEKTGAALCEPADLLVDLVDKGHLGKKAGKGFYTHDAGATPAAAAAGAAAGARYETLIVHTDVETKVQTITLNRPHRLNAIDPVLVEELQAAIRAADKDENVAVVVITGSGEKAFCVGADLQEAAGVAPPVAVEVVRRMHRVLMDVEKCGKPVIAAINGHAFGGGLEIALACDFRLAAKRARMGLPEVTLGLLPAAGGTQRLPKLVGLARAKEIAMLGNKLDADAALQYGIVTRVLDNDQFEQGVKEFAAELATRAPLALRYTKQLLNAAPTTEIATGMEMEAAAFGILSSTEDVIEGVSSLFMKKKPEFKGK